MHYIYPALHNIKVYNKYYPTSLKILSQTLECGCTTKIIKTVSAMIFIIINVVIAPMHMSDSSITLYHWECR